MAASTNQAPDPIAKAEGFWQRRLVRPISTQLQQGATARELSWAVAISGAIGIFPILGTTTVLGLLVGVIFRLNQTVIHSILLLTTPLHILLIVPFVRLGEWVVSADRVSFSFPRMIAMFKGSPAEFFQQYGATCLHCILAWALVAPLLIILLYAAASPLIRRARKPISQLPS